MNPERIPQAGDSVMTPSVLAIPEGYDPGRSRRHGPVHLIARAADAPESVCGRTGIFIPRDWDVAVRRWAMLPDREACASCWHAVGAAP